MTTTHVSPHGTTKNGRKCNSRKLLAVSELPLLGSNQDSSDPESLGAPGYRMEGRADSRQIATERDTRPTKSHTVRHTPSNSSATRIPRPLQLGGGSAWGGK
jgi:hypothetical protein